MIKSNFRRCLLEPIPQHKIVADLLETAADAFLSGNNKRCAELLIQADMREMREFEYKVSGPISLEIHRQVHMPKFTPIVIKGIKRMPPKAVERDVYRRDGWRCRFCGSKIIAKEARDVFRKYFPAEARKGRTNEENHFGLATLTATLDHIIPHKRGGSNEPNNLVAACGPCQFGRGQWLLEEVELEDPRIREPIIDYWDGLTRLLKYKQKD